MASFFWGLACLSAILAGLILFFGLANAKAAPQEAAIAAISAAVAVIPYCFARAISELSGPKTVIIQEPPKAPESRTYKTETQGTQRPSWTE